MRLCLLTCLVLLGCGAPTLGKTCLGDTSCSGTEVCSGSSSGPSFCTLPCTPSGQEPDVSYCPSAVGAGSNCEKYVGPDSAGYACTPKR
jgi:hypothetical protein